MRWPGAARREHHRQQERMRAETARRNAEEAARRAQQAQQDAMRRMMEQQQQQQQAMLTQQAEAYRKQAEATIEAGRLQIQELQNQRAQQQAATELQQRLAIQSQVSKARGGQQAALQIAPSAPTESTAGTAAFKRRGRRMQLAPIQTTAGINVPTGSTLNV